MTHSLSILKNDYWFIDFISLGMIVANGNNWKCLSENLGCKNFCKFLSDKNLGNIKITNLNYAFK